MLIDQGAWEVVPADEDPLTEHRPAQTDCEPDLGWYIEIDTLEVDTTFCNYVALRQPTLAPIEAGVPVHVGLYRYDLGAAEPAQAHVAVLVDGQVLWEQFIEIPNTARIYGVKFDSPISAPIGAKLMVHLHNHGQNQWAVEDVSSM